MIVRDYNGTGAWSCESILQRYAILAERLGVKARDLSPRTHERGNSRWVFPVMDNVIEGVEASDPACIAIAIDFIEEDQGFPFGSKLKSNTARALRRARLTEAQQQRIRRRVAEMLLKGYTPHEYREYAKLLRAIGVGEIWPEIEGKVDLSHPHVARHYHYFERALAREREGV